MAAMVVPALNAAPIIAEFQASNKDTIEDEDGKASDWIEIHNPGDSPVDLEGLSLTGQPDLPRLWIFPAYTLQPGESLLVWASGNDRRDPGGPLHTNFKLSADGGYLALVAPDGAGRLSEFNPYPKQKRDQSYGVAGRVEWEEVLAAGAPCQWKVPEAPLPNWEQPGFIPDDWNSAHTGLGYDVVPQDVDYLPLIGEGGNTETSMLGLRTSCLVRIPFSVTNTSRVVAMKLRVCYDSGFAVFLNGVRLDPPAAEATNAPEHLTHDAASRGPRVDAEAMLEEDFSLSTHVHLLNEGENLLCFQLLSHEISDSGALFLPKLSVARKVPETQGIVGTFTVPTPRAFNAESAYEGFVGAPAFSIRRNFLDGLQTVVLATETPGARVFYTTDGSDPDENAGTPYDTPIEVATTQVLRARAFLEGWHPSPVVSHTYIFAGQVVRQPSEPAGFPATWGWDENGGSLDPQRLVKADYAMDPGVTGDPLYRDQMEPALTGTLPVVSLSLPVDLLFGLNGMYANGRVHRTEKPASFEFFDPASGETCHQNASLRIHGGNTPNEHPKKPFRIYFRKRLGGEGELAFPLFPGSPVESFEVLQLRPGGHDGWSVPFGSGDKDLARHATYLRDRFLRETELAMGRLSPRGRYVHLYLNGLYWGIYDLHEVPKEEFFADHLGGKKNEWDVVEHTNRTDPLFDVVDGSGKAMEELLKRCRPPEAMKDEEHYRELREYLDVDDFIDHLIVQMWGANNDWMGPVYLGEDSRNVTGFFNKNWQAGRRSRGSVPGGFHWCVWDAEISMGSHHAGALDHQREVNFDHTRIGERETATGSGKVPGPPAEIYHALRHNALFRRRFGDRLQKHLFHDGALSPEQNLARLGALQEQLEEAIVAESARWGDVNSGNPEVVTFTRDEHWHRELEWLKETFLPQRNAILLRQFGAIGIWPGVGAPSFSQHGGEVTAGSRLELRQPSEEGGTVYYTLDGSDPAADDGAVSGTAIEYEEALELAGETTVKARIFRSGEWSPLVEALFNSSSEE